MTMITKVVRFVKLYGLARTLIKISGRARKGRYIDLAITKRKLSDVAVIGCGQFGFSTIGYFISRYSQHRILSCLDIDQGKSSSFSRFYGCESIDNVDLLLENDEIQSVYISSNHASHTPYAVKCIDAGKTTFIEKPIAVSRDQMLDLHNAVYKSDADVYCGYNRPHSGAIKLLRKYNLNYLKPLTLSFFVSGHVLEEDHWYRHPQEGTRICGNVGHWLDLMVHILSWGDLPDSWKIQLTPSSNSQRDEDVSISLVSARGDLVNIILTARTEPFEGINESINLQWDNLIVKIDDFRKMDVWQESARKTHRFWPKDVGHKGAILQPFVESKRPWKEIELSTLLMLHIKDMVENGTDVSEFSFSKAYNSLVKK